MPGGANGIALKLNSPYIYAYDDNFGFTLAFRSRLRVMFVWGSSRSHSAKGKFGSTEARHDLKCSLNIWIALSAYLQYLYSATS